MSIFNLMAHLHAPARAFPKETPAAQDNLIRVWQEVLGSNEISIDDDFFDLGGDSLLALDLVAKIEALCGKKLPLNSLVQARTVRQMAQILGREEASSSWPSLVPIQTGGTQPPLFCVHPIGGDVLCYQSLGRHLGPDQPVYALRARGLDGIQEPHRSVEEMAHDYVSEMRHFKPEGPYFICGYSFGGLVAFEMATQLEAQGQKTSLLAVFDSRKPVSAPCLLLRGGALLTRLRFGTLARKVRHQVTRQGRRLKNWWAQSYYNFTRQPLPPDLAHHRATASCGHAARQYTPGVYQGRLIFFRAVPSAAPAAPVKAQITWEKHAARGVETHLISCEHQSMLYEPHVSVVAAQLQRCIRNAKA